MLTTAVWLMLSSMLCSLHLASAGGSFPKPLTAAEREATIRRLEKEMKEASKMLEFEYAAVLRDQIIELRGGK